MIAGAGLAALQASASPIRVVVVTSHQEVTSNMRFGHAAADAAKPGVAHMIHQQTELHEAGPKKHHPACVGGKLREKAFELSNAFRHALGFPPIEKHVENGAIHGGLIHIMPMPFVGTPATKAVAASVGDEKDQAVPPPELHLVHSHGQFPHPYKHHRGPFLRRIHNALMALGPWEGRAVAFVLGCGIGVLLRMIWVMAIVTYRIFRGENEEDAEYTELVFEQDAEDIVVPPPQYQYSDEKAEVADSKSVEQVQQ
ncbi:hypothetical protein PLICRDRAFT_172334 [Plicaturopsis crispa FD-325 SS-3]|nr:hypothetical protein PLICRDRAFT_172334 [Plicaturopsis crispa FD-325 SS-3]